MSLAILNLGITSAESSGRGGEIITPVTSTGDFSLLSRILRVFTSLFEVATDGSSSESSVYSRLCQLPFNKKNHIRIRID